MDNEFDNLKTKWKAARENSPGSIPNFAALVSTAEAKKKNALYHQFGNIIVLTIVLITISLCFYFFFPFRERLSHLGMFLMIAGLMIRIGVEIFSTIKSRHIQFADHALKTATNTLAYYNFRKTINGPVTISLVVTYVIGFYILTPEFIKYVDWRWMLLFDVLFTISGVILIWQIRKGIRKEMDDLRDMVHLHEDLNKKV
jgi:hypothetical protein